MPAHAAPSMGASSPTAFGLGWGEAYLAANFQARVRYSADPDGALAAGLGLGDPAKLLGLEIDVISFSTLPSRGGPAGFGGVLGVDVKLHRLFSRAFGLAVGWESVLSTSYQGVETDGGSNQYAVFSAWIPISESGPFRDLVLSLGAGSGRFLPERKWADDADQFGPFGSIALRIAPAVSLVADWAGQDLLLGTSFAPLSRHSLVINAGVADVLGTTGGTGQARFVASTSYAFRYLKF